MNGERKLDPTRKDGGIPEEPIELRILFYPRANQYQASGPHQNSGIFLAMLEMAKIIHYEFRAEGRKNKAQGPLVVVPNMRVPPQV